MGVANLYRRRTLKYSWPRCASLRASIESVGRRRQPAVQNLWRASVAEDASSPPPRGPQVRDERLARLEAVLFIAREPLTTRRIAKLAGLDDGTEARSLIRRLNSFYDLDGSAFTIEQIAGGYQLLTRPMFGPWLRRLLRSPVETRLSAPAMETLAVIAYRQPVGRAEIESIRGVQCSDLLKQLLDRDLTRIVGRSEELGRPILYGTTKRFLQTFGLRSVEQLPMAEQMRRPAEQPAPATGGTASVAPTQPSNAAENGPAAAVA